MHRHLAALLVCAGSVAFGVGGSGGGAAAPATPSAAWVAGVFEPASNFAARCEAPRSGIDPGTGRPYPDRIGTALQEKNWLRSWSNDLYLWYSEIVDRDPAPYTTLAYFDSQTTGLAASGRAKDRPISHIRRANGNNCRSPA
jgi:hypothetical protein